MRARERSDWTHDLNTRHTIEREVEHTLRRHDTIVAVQANTASKDDLDFVVTDRRQRQLTIELKTKRQLYSTDWSLHREASGNGEYCTLRACEAS